MFGATLGNKALVWRSGVGVDANGALIYAGGPALSVLSLADPAGAGAVRAMELDINTDWVSAFTYVPEDIANPSSTTVGQKLLDNMSRSGDHYFSPGTATSSPSSPTPRSSTLPAPRNSERTSYLGSRSREQEFMQ